MTPMYSQNGELIYPSDSEESVPATSTATSDNRAITPHSTSSLSPNPKLVKLQQHSPTTNSRDKAESYSPRYSPPNLPAAPSHVNLQDNLMASSIEGQSSNNHQDALRSYSHRENQMNTGHMGPMTSALTNSMTQKFKASPSSSPVSQCDMNYGLGTNSNYIMSGQYQQPGMPNMNSNQSSY